MGQTLREFANEYLSNWYLPDVKITDLIEIVIVAFLLYHVMVWIKNTKAWMLLKGMSVLVVFILIATVLKMNTILWIAKNSIGVLATAAVIVFQPELRRALEKLGQKDFLSSFLPFDKTRASDKFTEDTIEAIVNACYEMGSVKTGALIVVENEIVLTEYEHTGIALDCLVSEQMLVNIFEHNTPLHDGAVIIRENRIVSATCYLPLSENKALSKQLGTRHRAAVGMSEVSDAVVVCVSEESGSVSYAVGGKLMHNVSADELRSCLGKMQSKPEEKSKKYILKKGRRNHERQIEK